MSNKLKRFLSLMLVFVMVLSIVPANAEDLGVVVSGTSTSEESGPSGASSAFDKLTAAFGNNNAPEEEEKPGDDTTGDDATTGGDTTTGDDATTGGDTTDDDATTGGDTTDDDATTGDDTDDDATTGGDPMTEGGTVAGGNGNSNLRIKVAQIGETRFNSLKEAVNAAAEGQTIMLLTDVEMSSSMTIDKAITLDLNGKTIILTHGGVIKIAALDKVVTISNGTVKADKGATAIRVIAGAEVALPGCTVDGELIDENIPVEDTAPGDAVEGDDETTGDEPAVDQTPEGSLGTSDEKENEGTTVLHSSLVDISNPEKTFFTAEITGLNATESVVIKLFDAEGTLLATTTLLKPEYFVMDTLGVKIIIAGATSSSWETVWEEGMLSSAHVPSYMELYVDGDYINTANVPMVCTNGEQSVEWADVPGVPAAPVEVATFEELVAALAKGGNILLTADITTTAAIVTSGIEATVDLGGYTLTFGAGDNKFNDETNLTIENGTINITGLVVKGNGVFCLDEYEETLKTTLTLNNVNMVGEGYSSAYTVFYIGPSSTLNVNGGVWNLKNDAHTSGGVFKADSSAATLNISGATMELHNVRRVVTYAATTIENTTMKVTGDADGVDAEMEHGFNRSPLKITDSTITMSDMVGRGITAENGAVDIINSTITMTNCQEATIDVRNGQTVTIDATSNVTVDAEPTISSGEIVGTVNVVVPPAGTITYGFVDESSIWGEATGNAKESFVIELYVGETRIATSTLNNIDNIIDGDVYVTWSIPFAGSTGGFWTAVWEAGYPNAEAEPTKVVLVVDGEVVAENSTRMSGPDDLNPVVWKELDFFQKRAQILDADGNVLGTYNNFESAIAAACSNANVTRIEILQDITQTSIANPGETYVIGSGRSLSIGAAEGESYTVTLTRAGNESFSIYQMEGSSSLTIDSNVKLIGLDIIANGFATAGDNLVINGDVEAMSLKQWSSNGEIIVNGNVKLGYGDGQLDLAYGNGSLTVNGSLKAGYSGTRGNGNVINVNGAYDAGAWFNMNGSNGTINVNNAEMTVSGGDASGKMNVNSTGNNIVLTNNGTLTVATLALAEGNKITINATSKLNVKTLTGAGSIVVDAAEMKAGDTIVLTADVTGFTGAVEVINNDKLEAVLEDNTIVLSERKLIEVTYPDGTVEYYADMLEAVPYTTNCPRLEGAIVKLLADIEAPGIRMMENGMVLDLNDFTYTITAGTGSQGTNTSGFQIRPEVTTVATIKNGTIKVAEGAPVVWMFNNYATGFVVENVTVDCTNMAWSYGESCYVHVSRAEDSTQFTGSTQIINFNAEVGGAAINVGGTMTIADTAVPGGTIELDAGAKVIAREGLDVVTTADGYTVSYADGAYTCVLATVTAQNEDGTTTGYASLAEALEATKDQTNVVINLLADATLDIAAWKTLAIGGEATKTITINGNGNTLTFNKKDSDWDNVATNGAKLILNNMTITDSGYNNGPWNRYDIVFDCPVELNSVTSTKALAFESSAVLNTVTINESGDNYAIWIQPNGQTVSINGLTVNSAGRGIKIDDQYVDNAGHVTLTVNNATFTTAKKAAIMVKSSAGATVTVENVDIANVAADSVNVVWNDEDAAAYFGKINVTGGTKAQEGDFAAAVSSADGAVQGYYGTIAEAITAAKAGETVTIFAGDYTGDVSVNKAITVVGETDENGNNLVNINGKLSVSGQNATVKNLNVSNSSGNAGSINGGNILVEGCNLTGSNGLRYCYANEGDVTIRDCVITGGTYGVHFDAGSGEGDVIIEGSTITGWTSFGSAIEGVTITNTAFLDGNYDQLRFFQDATVTGCTFPETMNIDFGKDGVTAEFNGCKAGESSSVADVVYLGDIVEMGVKVYVDGELLVVAATVTDAANEKGYYLTLAEAVAAAQAGETITLLVDGELADGMTVSDITIDLAGHTLTIAEDKTIDVSGSLTLNGEGTVAGSIVLTDAAATVTGPEGLNVTTNVADHKVVYADSVYSVVACDYVAEVGGVKYESLDEAFKAAVDGDEVKILKAGTYALNTSGKDITITGDVAGVVFDNIGARNLGGASITFNNVTFNYATTSTYKGLQHSGDLTYNNCTINGQVFLYGTSESFNNCTFNTTDANNYNVWLYSAANVEFSGCTFNCAGKSVLLYHEGANVVNNVNVVDCDFIATSAVEGKAAIEIDTSLMVNTTSKVTIDAATTATGFGAGSVSGETLWNDKKDKTNIEVWVDNEQVWPIFVAQIGETKYTALTAALDAAQAGETVILLKPVELTEAYELTKSIGLEKKGLTLTGELQLNDAALTLTSTDADLNVTTNVEGKAVVYENGVYAIADAVASVTDGKGNVTYYGTIDEAVAAWTNGTTLTLLADVTLSDVIQLSSTEYHILNLGTYTMTAAKSKNAIEIVNNGRSSASWTLDIKADAENPGGITATGKAIVKTTGKSGVKDRPIIRFYNGVFNASYIAQHSGSNGTNCPQFYFYDGEFNGTISTNRTLNLFHGGTFNGSLMMSVDSSAYTLISGGRFKQLSNLYMSALNSGKFTIGSAKGVYDKGIYVDVDGYFVVGGPVITTDDAEGTFALSTTYHSQFGTNGYLTYSSAAANGLFYKENTTVDLVKVITDTAAQSSAQKLNLYQNFDLSGEITVKNNLTVNLNTYSIGDPTFVLTKKDMVLTSDTELANVTTNVDGYMVAMTVNADGKYEYKVSEAVAQIGDKMFGSLDEAFEAAVDGDEVKILKAGTYALNTSGKNITITGAVAGVVFDNIGARNLGGASITFNNVTFNYATDSTYKGLQHSGDLTYNNCTINGQVFLYGTSESFNNCIFNTTDANNYNVWTYGAKNVKFDGCTFNCAGKSVLVYNEGGPATNLVVNGSTFNATSSVEGKAAIEIDTTSPNNAGGMDGTVITITGTTATGFAAGSISGETLWNDKKDQINLDVYVDGEHVWPIFVAQIGETKYTSLDKALEAAKDGETVILLKDVELTEAYELTKSIGLEKNDLILTGELQLNDAALTLTSTDADLNVTTTLAGKVVVYENGVYAIADAVASVTDGEGNVTCYGTLAAAIAGAEAGDTITFLASITEDVTVDKNVTVDGAEFQYTGTMTVANSKTVTIENVNFVKGCITEAKGSHGNLTVKECDFDGVDNTVAYAVTMRGGDSVTMEGCTAKNYDYGMLYVPSAVSNVTVKDVTAEGFNYGVHVAYGVNVALENVKMTNVAYGIMTQNYGAKTITVKNSELNGTNAIYVWERNTTVVDTFKFEGANTATALPAGTQAKLVLVDVDSTLTAPEGFDVITEVAEHKVVYEDGMYKVVEKVYVAQIGEAKYETLAEAVEAVQDGEIIELIANVELTEAYELPKSVTLETKGYTLTGELQLNDAALTLTSTDADLNVTTNVEGKIVVYENGVYAVVDAVASVTDGEGNVTYYGTLDKAFAAAEDGDVVTILVAGTYALNTSGKDITITGDVAGVVFDNIGAKNMGGANVTFNNVTFDYYPNVNYTGLQHSGNLTYNNCTFEGQVFLYGTSETFTGCTFNQNSADAYNVWTYGAKNVKFDGCTFNCAGKSVLVYNEGGPATNLVVNGSTFNATGSVEGKAAIEIDTTSPNNAGGMDGTVITITGTTATGFAAGSISGETLWNDKKDQTNLDVYVDGEHVWPIFVAQVGETKYTALQSAIDAAEAGDTVTVLKDIVLKQGVTIASDDSITLDLAGYTVSMTDASTSTSALITNNGTLKITGEGKLSYNATTPSTSYSTSTINNKGTLTVDNGTFENTSPAGGASYVIDNYGNLTVNGGSFSASRIVLRQAQFGNCNNTVTINGGTFTGYAGLQMHVFSAAKETTATINGGTFDGTYAFYTSFSAADVSANTKIVVNDGTFTGDAALYLYNSKTGAYDYAFDAEVKGGYFDGWVYIYAKNAEDTDVDLPVITGGTYTIEPAETVIAEGYIAQDNGNGTWTVIEGEWVAQIGETKYTTLQAAVDAAVNGDTVVLLTDIAEDVVVEQKPDVKFTINGDDKTIDGTITVNGKSARYPTAGLTIQNVNFKADTITENAFINLGGNNTIRYTSNVTVTNCTFTAEPRNEGIVAIKQYTGGCKNLTVDNCTATGVHSLIQLKNVEEGLTITDCTITDSKNGISVGNSVGAAISGCTMDVDGYGIRADGNIANKLTVSDCTIDADMPIVVRKTTAAYELAISGANTLTAGNADGYQVIFTNGDDGTYEEPTGAFVYTTDEANAELKVFPTFVAMNDGIKYTTFEAALAAAKANDTDKTVILLQPVEITEDTTYDLSDVTVTSEGDAFIVTGGTLTLNGDGVVKGGTSGAGSWTAVWANGGNVVINGGTYSVGGDSTTTDTTHQNDVIYTKNGGTVSITAGTFLNDGTVWTLNQNDATGGAITVTGGTFQGWNPADNVSEGANTNFVAEGYKAVDNGDGSWTVVEDTLFDIFAANVRAGDSLDMFFYVQKSDLDGEEYYAEIVRTFADGSADDVVQIPFSSWDSYNSQLFRFGYGDIAAKEMTDEMYVTVYNSDGTEASNLWTDSVSLYAVRALANATGELRTALVDMLNYGAAAQKYFGYNTSDLANVEIADYQQYATPSVSYTDQRVKGANYVGTTVSAKSRLMLTFYFRNITTDMTAHVSFADHYGNEETRTVAGSNFVKYGSYLGVDVTGLAIADGRRLVSCEVVDASGAVVASATDSVESYVARQATVDPVFELLMKFVESAYNYFH